MRDDSPSSSTAMAVAAMRAAQHRDPVFGAPGPDDVAHGLVDGSVGLLARFPALARRVCEWRAPGVYAWVYARTQVYDAFVRRALDGGIPQIVVLGAGFDTRAKRFEAVLHRQDAWVYELDHPATQAAKRNRVGSWPRARFVPIDFQQTPLEEALVGAGFDRSRPAAFFAEGVLMYLSQQAVRELMGAVTGLSVEGSRLAVDFVTPGTLDGSDSSYGAREIFDTVQKRGEPLLWGCDPREIHGFMAPWPWTVDTVLTPPALTARFLPSGPPITGFNSIVELVRQ